MQLINIDNITTEINKMTIVDIVKNAPEGAERYKAFNPQFTEYYAVIDGVNRFYFVSGGCWIECADDCNFNSSIPLPKLKTEWVKVKDSIFHPQLQVDFESGGLYTLTTDGAYKELEADENHLMVNLVASNLYRKVEKVVDEKQEFIERASEVSDHHGPTVFGKLYEAGCRFIELD